MDLDLFHTDDTPQPAIEEGSKSLTCTCPKCDARITLEFAEVAAGETTRTCPECKARYILTRESFTRRASRKSGRINCATCGGELTYSQYCPGCKTLYPDYFAAESPDAAKKRERQRHEQFAWLKNLKFEWQPGKPAVTGYHPTIAETDAWQEHTHPAFWNKKRLLLTASLVTMLLLTIATISMYSHMQAKKKYASNYILALYGVKLGSDLSFRLCKQLAMDWSARSTAGSNSPPTRISADDENQLNTLKSKTDSYLQKLANPPGTFADANAKLMQLNSIYGKVHASAQNPAGTVSGFMETTQKAEKDFQEGVASLKQSLPPELQAKLEVAKLKYKAMSNI